MIDLPSTDHAMRQQTTWALLALATTVWLGCADEPAQTTTGGGGSEEGGGGGVGGNVDVGGGGGSLPAGASVDLAPTLALPYVTTDAGAVTATFAVRNTGDLPAEGDGGGALAWTLDGDASLSLTQAPERLAPGEQGEIVLTFAGSDVETIAHATLAVTVDGTSHTARVFAVAGDASLSAGDWDTVSLPGNAPCGDGLTVALPTAPFPHASASYTDDTVRIFVPEGLRDVGVQDVVVHFHGHLTDVQETLSEHLYEEQFCASGVNGVLVVPQGPVQAASGNFGKLMEADGLAALVQQVMVVLYRDARIVSPALGELVLTAHSGGYLAVAENLTTAINPLGVSRVHLYDALYARESTFVSYVESGGWLRSNYTVSGGTLDNNESVSATLSLGGTTVSTEVTQHAHRDAPVIIAATDSSHAGATRVDGVFGEQLRFAMPSHRRGPRVELRQAVAANGEATVRWFSPHEEGLLGVDVLTSMDGVNWEVVAEVAPTASSTTFPWSGVGRVQVMPRLTGDADEVVLGSDVYRVGDQPTVLIVDGFDRVVDGSHGRLVHDFAARVGEAVGSVATVSNEAVTEDGFDLTPYAHVVWLVGDESTDDRTLSAAEQQILTDYLSGGGRLIVSGSEVAYDLGGGSFLSNAFGATYVADDSGSLSFDGVGPLAGISGDFSGPGTPYPEDFPDVLGTVNSGEIVLEYDNGDGAAVGISGRAVLVAFPLELIDVAADRSDLLSALFDFLGA